MRLYLIPSGKGISGINPMQKRVIKVTEYGINQTDIGQVITIMGDWYSSLPVYTASLSFKRYCLDTGTGSLKPLIVSQ
jgi:hypothetical protein